MELVVSNQSVASKLKTALLAAIIPAVAVIHALGYDWGATTDNERIARDSAVILTATAAIVLCFALYAHFKKTTVGEPVAVAGSIAGVISAALALVLAFDWVSEGVSLAVFALVSAVLLPFGISLTRQQVWPASRVQHDSSVEPQDALHAEGGQVETGLLLWVAVIALVAIAIGVLIIAL